MRESGKLPRDLQIDPPRTALVLLDYQNYSVHPDGYWAQAMPGSAERAAPAVARAAELVVRKRAVSGFAATELDRPLYIHDLSTLVITGIVTIVLERGVGSSICISDPCLADDRYVHVEADAAAIYPSPVASVAGRTQSPLARCNSSASLG